MARRLSADAKIVLERAGYHVEYTGTRLWVDDGENGPNVAYMEIEGGTVDNGQLVGLLAVKDCDPRGYKMERYK